MWQLDLHLNSTFLNSSTPKKGQISKDVNTWQFFACAFIGISIGKIQRARIKMVNISSTAAALLAINASVQRQAHQTPEPIPQGGFCQKSPAPVGGLPRGRSWLGCYMDPREETKFRSIKLYISNSVCV